MMYRPKEKFRFTDADFELVEGARFVSWEIEEQEEYERNMREPATIILHFDNGQQLEIWYSEDEKRLVIQGD